MILTHGIALARARQQCASGLRESVSNKGKSNETSIFEPRRAIPVVLAIVGTLASAVTLAQEAGTPALGKSS